MKINKTTAQSNGRLKPSLAVDLSRNWCLYLMVLPLALYYILFHYVPMFGLIVAFENYTPMQGIFGSDFVGFENFIKFFSSPYFWTLLRNTVRISLSVLIFSFPAPIILALLLNEIKSKHFRSVTQTVSYLPHFISLAVVCGMVKDFTLDSGIVNDVAAFFGFERVSMLSKPEYFVPVYVVSDIWQHLGWNSIIYISALAGIDQELYEAAQIDGAGKWKQMLNVTLPGIAPTIIIMLLLKIGNILNIGYEKIILLYNPLTYDTADVLQSFIYRRGLQEFDWGYSTAAGMFNSVINTILLISANKISNKVSETALW